MDGGGRDELTLVIGLAALQRLARPAEAVADARRWSGRVGVASDRPVGSIRDVLDERDVECDFVSGSGGRTGSLAAVRQQFRSERHVFVGTDDRERQTAQALGWEYLPIEEAAAKADWALVDDEAG